MVNEEDRLRAEVAALRASLGETTGAEPIGCPVPGACCAIALHSSVLNERKKLQAIKDFIAKQREESFLDFIGRIKDSVLRQVQEEIERIEKEIP